MTAEAAPAVLTSSPRRKRPLILVLAGALVLGAAGGGAVWWTTSRPAEDPANIAASPEGSNAEEGGSDQEAQGEPVGLDVGRIAVTIAGGNGQLLNMLVAPLILCRPAEGEGEHGDAAPSETQKAQLRDSFIEYLSQLGSAEVRGSAGLATIRAELLRRTRAVAPDLNAEAVLIQDFLIQ